MLGSALVSLLREFGLEMVAPTRSALDLVDERATLEFLTAFQPDIVIHSAARVFGILENKDSNAVMYDTNVRLDNSVLRACRLTGVSQVVVFGSSCAYPIDEPQPFSESSYKDGVFEPTNEGYARAKQSLRAGVAGLRSFGINATTLVLPNLYGPGDKVDLVKSHLVSASLVKTLAAKETGSDLVIWGTGKARREFLFAPDVAKWVVDVIAKDVNLPLVLNLGAGKDHSVLDYYRLAARLIGFQGRLMFDLSKPEGIERKLMDDSLARATYGWDPVTELEEGMSATLRDVKVRVNR